MDVKSKQFDVLRLINNLKRTFRFVLIKVNVKLKIDDVKVRFINVDWLVLNREREEHDTSGRVQVCEEQSILIKIVSVFINLNRKCYLRIIFNQAERGQSNSFLSEANAF